MARSLLVGATLGLRRVRATRLRPLDFTPFEPAIENLAGKRQTDLDELVGDASIAALQKYLDSGELTSEDLTAHLLGRVRRFDESLCSVIELNPFALFEAREADERRRLGTTIGPLDGIPITIKDNIETAGPMHTTAGAALLADHVADADAPLVVALRSAGAVIIGKANLSELAGAVVKTPGVSAVGGQTRNPYGHAFSPGGSSSGSAVAVAAGLCVVSVGTETSGSLIAPATFNGVVGIKPSYGAVDGNGIVPLVRRQDTAGAIGRCVADAAALLSVIVRGEIDAPTLSSTALRDVRVGVLEDEILSQKSPYENTSDNAAILTRITDGLHACGAVTTKLTVPEAAFKQFQTTFSKVVLGGLACDTTAYLAAAGTPVKTIDDLQGFNLAEPRARMPKGQFFVDLATFTNVDPQAYETSSPDHCRKAAEIIDATFAAGKTDLLVSISSVHSNLYATAGCPAITVPLGLRANGMPAGVTFIGRRGEDARLVAWAFAFEQATHLRVRPALNAR